MILAGVEASKISRDKALLSYNLFNQAIFHSVNDNSVLALDTYKQLEQTYRELIDYRALGNVYNNKGVTSHVIKKINVTCIIFHKLIMVELTYLINIIAENQLLQSVRALLMSR